MKSLISILILIPSLCFAGDFDKHDKELFASVCLFQVVDGLTIMSRFKNNSENYISNGWSWEYGTKRPSPGRMWGVKGVQLIGAYYVGKALPSKWRKGFYIAVDSILLYCIQHNLRAGAGFSITF